MSNRNINPTTDMMFKIIIVGDSGVGKTNLLTYFCEGVFKQSYVATIGVDFKDKRIKLQIWDTAGQQRFRNITQTYYKGASGILLAYSVADNRSYNNIATWIKQIEANSRQDVCKILIGTKCDLQSDRQVTYQQGNVLAKKYGLQYMEVSSKLGKNVHQCFNELAKQLKSKRQKMPDLTQKQTKITAGELKSKQKKNCQC